MGDPHDFGLSYGNSIKMDDLFGGHPHDFVQPHIDQHLENSQHLDVATRRLWPQLPPLDRRNEFVEIPWVVCQYFWSLRQGIYR